MTRTRAEDGASDGGGCLRLTLVCLLVILATIALVVLT